VPTGGFSQANHARTPRADVCRVLFDVMAKGSG
jgi:hypothetical protein